MIIEINTHPTVIGHKFYYPLTTNINIVKRFAHLVGHGSIIIFFKSFNDFVYNLKHF